MIEIFDDLNALSGAAARLFAEHAQNAVEVRGRFAVAISGGRTPLRTYELLRQRPHRDRVPWPKVHVFWADERCVPDDDLRSNYRMAREALLDHVPIPADQIHAIPGSQDPGEAAERYEALIREFFRGLPPRLDLVYLGLGEDGHTASLFPGTPALEEQRRWVVAVQVAGQSLSRVSLTAALLNQAAVVAFLVAGAEKAAVLRAVLEGPREPWRLPAQLIRPANGDPHWLVEQAAAGSRSKEAE